jgi:hypothetical protein
MAQVVTVASVIERIREASEMENTQFITDAELVRRVNQSYKRLYNEIVNTFEDYFVKTEPIVGVADITDYAVPADFYKLLYLVTTDSGITYQLNKIQLHEVATQSNNITATTPRNYILIQGNIRILRAPAAGQLFTLYYVPTAAELAAGSSFDAVNGWDQYIVEQVAIQCLAKEESDTSDLRADFERTRQDLFAYFKNRDAGGSIKVRDIYEEVIPWR